MRVNLEARAASAEQRRLRTRERLLDAAERIVADKGVEQASIEEFVVAAGVSRGTFYNYFPTATDLLNALNLRVAAHLDDALDRLSPAGRSPAALLALSLHMVLAAYLDDPVRGWVALQLAHSRAPRVRSFEARFAALYVEGVRQGQFREIAVSAAWTVAFGSMRMVQRDVVAGAATPVEAAQVIALVLAAFGLPYDEAERVSRDEAVAARRI
ncbi:TetR/AcrR family transcriptional regulator [Phenylobacterium sp.]|uniref:TetR/AcrR family transcriptional regulator n=1 Tax=Phenylobacterium sp. TaxID=1871053 RepID=UPI00374D3342